VTGALDSTFRPLAVALISRFGTPATLRRRTASFSAATGRTTNTDVDTAVVITPPAPAKQSRKGAGAAEGSESLTIEAMFQCMLAAQGLAVVPTALTDHVVHDGKEWHVVDVEKVWSGNLVAAYKLTLKE
jgi:hypothetical protein